MTDETESLIADVAIFSDLDPATRAALAREMETLSATAGTVLITQGDPGDCLYVLTSGRLRITVRDDDGEHVLREVGPGEIVGEMALLSDELRSATVTALRDCQLMRLRTEAFASLLSERPQVLAPLSRLLVRRLVELPGTPADARPRTIVVGPAGAGSARHAALATDLAAEMARRSRTTLISAEDVDRALGAGAANRTPGDPGWGDVARWMSNVEHDHDYVVYETDAEPTAWTRTCLRQGDLILLVADRDGDPRLHAIEILLASSSLNTARRELVLVRRLDSGRTTPTAAWLNDRKLDEHHHLAEHSAGDLARLARAVRGQACGLVLSGGGSRGLAHLGAMQALEEAGVPFDYVGGTSIGAVMGAAAAMGLDHEQRMQRSAVFRSRRGVLDVTLPLIALATGRRIDEMLQASFADIRIEDLVRPFFCVSADLVSARETVHDRGVLWRAVRASLSIPGVFPPVSSEHGILVDGATLNNLPADKMRDRLPLGTIVAVDLQPSIGSITHADRPGSNSGWRELGRRIRHHARGGDALTLVDILSRANSLSGVRLQNAKTDRAHIDLHLRPELPPVGALDFRGALPFVDLAYRSTREVLETTAFADRFR